MFLRDVLGSWQAATAVTLGTGIAPGTAPMSAMVRRQLEQLGLTDAAMGIDCWIDWAGPVDMRLDDESAVQAACGIMHVHGRRSGHPEPLAVDYACTVASIIALQGVLAALIARARGRGIASVRTSVTQAALLSVSQYLASATAGEFLVRSGHDMPPPFTSADGVRFELEALEAETWQRFWRALGAPDGALRSGWPHFQRRFATATCPLPAELHDVAARHRLDEVLAASARAGTGVMRVRDCPSGGGPATPWRVTPLPGTARRLRRPSDLPLEGIVVVESARRVQGPLAGHVLHMLGAEVIRIEPPGGDPQRGEQPEADGCSARFLALNKGKRVVEMDLKTQTGRAAVAELVSGADVFLHNWAQPTALRLGLDVERLARVRPGLVYAAASGWGDALGPRPQTGTDYLVQAHSGLAAALRPQGTPPAPSLMTITDVLGGLVCAQGVLAALFQRVRTGRGARVESSLLSATGALPRPQIRPVWTPFDRPVRTADGYLMLSAQARSTPALTHRGLGLPDDERALAARLRSLPTAEWMTRLAAVGLGGVQVCDDLRELPRDPRFNRAITAGRYATVVPPWEFN